MDLQNNALFLSFAYLEYRARSQTCLPYVATLLIVVSSVLEC